MVDVDMLNSVVERQLPYKWSYNEQGNLSNTLNWKNDFVNENLVLGSTYLLLISISMAVGCIGNALVIGSVCVYKKLHTTGNIFIVNLAIADMLVTAIVDPFSIIGVVFGARFFRDKIWLCHLVASVCSPSCFCSLWTIATIAVNRYMFMVWNPLYHSIFTWRKSFIMCIILWCICIVSFDLPAYFGWGGHVYDMKIMICQYDRLSDYSFTTFLCAFGIVIPTGIIALCYIKLYLYVSETKQRVRKFKENGTTGSGNREEVQLANTLFLIAVVYLVCMTPYTTLFLIDIEDRYPKIVYVFAVALAHTNCSLNSVIYGATNRRFREGYKIFLGFCCFPVTNVYKRCWVSNSDTNRTSISITHPS